uniref:Uncharacterized protein n=1 Tax=Panagrolaimus sp. PS1159 TaxID=55785 RepID=A0AC35FQ26_9BILA
MIIIQRRLILVLEHIVIIKVNCSTFFWDCKIIYQPSPTWGNHVPLFKFHGVDVKNYRYYDKGTCGFYIEMFQ